MGEEKIKEERKGEERRKRRKRRREYRRGEEIIHSVSKVGDLASVSQCLELMEEDADAKQALIPVGPF